MKKLDDANTPILTLNLIDRALLFIHGCCCYISFTAFICFASFLFRYRREHKRCMDFGLHCRINDVLPLP